MRLLVLGGIGADSSALGAAAAAVKGEGCLRRQLWPHPQVSAVVAARCGASVHVLEPNTQARMALAKLFRPGL